ncbi:MAG: thioredoxin domain-containing protein [Acidobacteria bacterium]|nr:thioredoxin domain-containing protein [Acidobacteriota bacterium]
MNMNRLSRERSPYLLQHASNPVDWYSWSEEAFARARTEDKPVFLSIGYSTCHWCHVMEHESFENDAIAQLLNRDFVSIKVDREERPDVDRVYMAFVQATTGAGGWPMTVFLTPELKPFFGGTYFPPSSKWGRPGFTDLLAELARVWKEDRPRVEHAAAELLERLKLVTRTTAKTRVESAVADESALDAAIEQYQMAFDRRRGGFGDAPKFPRPSELLFLLREHARRLRGGSGAAAPLLMATDTLRAMALGGMRDHIGGGFHRYAVDAEWRVPHFEKMLYDQAQLSLAYLEAAQATGDPFYAAVAEDTLQYVMRDMTHKEGGFYCAEDADSVPPEEAANPQARQTEGAFYIWRDAEIEALLGEDAGIARRRFGIEPDGNAPSDPQGEFTGRNLLYTAQSIEEIAIRVARPAADVMAALARIRQALFTARERRPRPHVDDKVLTAWNGVMIAAFARAARILDGESSQAYLQAARRAASFIRNALWDPSTRTLLRRFREGDAAIDGYAEDYAYLIFGLLELFQADGDPAWLDWALMLQARQDELFWDPDEGGWFSTSGDDSSVLLRLKEDYDGAEPAASSISVLNLLTLAHLQSSSDALAKSERTLARYGPRIGAAARALPMMLCALSAWHAGYTQVVIAGTRNAADTAALHAEAARHYLPFGLVVPVEPGASQRTLGSLMPFLASMTPRDGRAAAYVCREFACRQPVTDPRELEAELRIPTHV